jgi:hypothetical protein
MTDRKFPTEEPAADMREAAKGVRQMFVALVHEGFSEHQALMVVAEIIRSGAK